MIPINLNKLQAGLVWRMIKKMLVDYDMKQADDLIQIMDKIVPIHDAAKMKTSRCRYLFSRYHAHILWSTLKTMLDDNIITDPKKVMDLTDILTVLAVGLDS